jgi:hypothetical protein
MPEFTAAAPATPPPPEPVMAQPAAPALDPELALSAGRDLKLLGYSVGKAADPADPVFQRAILAFEKDQGFTEDGLLTPALAEKLKRLRAQLARPALPAQSGIFVYSDGSQRRQAITLLVPPPAGLSSDAPATFLLPLRPGMSGAYHLDQRDKAGALTPIASVTCKADKVVPLSSPLGVFDTIPVFCNAQSKGQPLMQWHSYYAIKLGTVIRQEASATSSAARDLVAIRPLTAGWPSAARMGLDWALTHALDTSAAQPVQWSSTAVPPHFEIHAFAALSAHDAGLPGDGNFSCRRFDLTRTGDAPSIYPGIACKNSKGAWSLPGTGIVLATPANGLEKQPAPSL